MNVNESVGVSIYDVMVALSAPGAIKVLEGFSSYQSCLRHEGAHREWGDLGSREPAYIGASRGSRCEGLPMQWINVNADPIIIALRVPTTVITLIASSVMARESTRVRRPSNNPLSLVRDESAPSRRALLALTAHHLLREPRTYSTDNG